MIYPVGVRGHLVRKTTRPQMQKKALAQQYAKGAGELNVAATKIQSVLRGHHTRSRLEYPSTLASRRLPSNAHPPPPLSPAPAPTTAGAPAASNMADPTSAQHGSQHGSQHTALDLLAQLALEDSGSGEWSEEEEMIDLSTAHRV